ncbi:MAG TPA: M20 family metallopeptidase [Chloroflexota bacterium]|nr:M20 family metallopeptidase [Chloroflexota bacterium]
MIEIPASSRDEVVCLLSELVAIESVNPHFPGGERGEVAMGNYLADRCARLGLEVRRQPVLPGRANVLAELKVPGAQRTLLLDSHLDTVSLDQMGPAGLQPSVRGDVLTGRGSCDTKASLAAMLLALERLVADPAGLRCNVLLLGSVDEEYLMRGAETFAHSGIHVDGAIVGEPTNLEVVVAHKGFVRWCTHTIGRAAHSSNPEVGNNAIYHMTDLITALRAEYEPLLAKHVHPLVGPATWSIGRISGGAAVNIVPEHCTIEIDRRLLPGETSESVLAEFDTVVAAIQQRHPGMVVKRDAPFGDVLAIDTPATAAIVRALASASEAIRGTAKLVGVSYGTNASKFVEAGIDCVVFGPGDVRQAHTADEFIAIDQVATAARIYEAVARSF